jgi:hypothetical protein
MTTIFMIDLSIAVEKSTAANVVVTGRVELSTRGGWRLIVAGNRSQADIDSIPGVDRGDRPDEIADLLIVELVARLLVNVFRNRAITGSGQLLGKQQPDSLPLVVIGALPPCRQAVEP